MNQRFCDKEFRLKIKLKNNRIAKMRERFGLSIKEAAALAGTSYNLWINYENLNEAPLRSTKRWKKDCAKIPWRNSALSIAIALKTQPEYLWPQAVIDIENTRAELELSASEAAFLIGDDMKNRWLIATDFEDTMISHIENVNISIEKAMTMLTPRERKILQYRFNDNMTLKEIGSLFDVNPERIRQIEAKALRKMRHPRIAQLLKEHIEG